MWRDVNKSRDRKRGVGWVGKKIKVMAACEQSERQNFHIYDHDYGNVQMINKKYICKNQKVSMRQTSSASIVDYSQKNIY